MTEENIKQAAIQDLCKAVRRGRTTDIKSMYYEPTRDLVLIARSSGPQMVNVAGDSVIAMLGDVMRFIQKHEGI
jgi:hypothetical protein